MTVNEFKAQVALGTFPVIPKECDNIARRRMLKFALSYYGLFSPNYDRLARELYHTSSPFMAPGLQIVNASAYTTSTCFSQNWDITLAKLVIFDVGTIGTFALIVFLWGVVGLTWWMATRRSTEDIPMIYPWEIDRTLEWKYAQLDPNTCPANTYLMYKSMLSLKRFNARIRGETSYDLDVILW